MEKTPEHHLRAMEAVDRAIVFGLRVQDSGFNTPNEYVAKYVSGNLEKFVGFASIYSNYDDPVHEIKRCVKEARPQGIEDGSDLSAL